VVSGVFLAAIALFSVVVFDLDRPAAGAPFLILVCVGGALLSLEWASMATPGSPVCAGVTATATVGAVLLAFLGEAALAWICIPFGALTAAMTARLSGAASPLQAAYGVLYFAPVGLLLIWLRESRQGLGWVLMLFATTWAADIAAFVFGNLFKGPKLWPRFSPNKTWSGAIGGMLGGMAAAVAVAANMMHLSLLAAGLIGLLGAMAVMAGDLWESMLKRRFGVKDSGALIPGHGGLLDRVDGLLFAVVVFAGARFADHLGWAH
jgi:phosphatidate cytidylyltransferase